LTIEASIIDARLANIIVTARADAVTVPGVPVVSIVHHSSSVSSITVPTITISNAISPIASNLGVSSNK